MRFLDGCFVVPPAIQGLSKGWTFDVLIFEKGDQLLTLEVSKYFQFARDFGHGFLVKQPRKTAGWVSTVEKRNEILRVIERT